MWDGKMCRKDEEGTVTVTVLKESAVQRSGGPGQG